MREERAKSEVSPPTNWSFLSATISDGSGCITNHRWIDECCDTPVASYVTRLIILVYITMRRDRTLSLPLALRADFGQLFKPCILAYYPNRP